MSNAQEFVDWDKNITPKKKINTERVILIILIGIIVIFGLVFILNKNVEDNLIDNKLTRQQEIDNATSIAVLGIQYQITNLSKSCQIVPIYNIVENKTYGLINVECLNSNA